MAAKYAGNRGEDEKSGVIDRPSDWLIYPVDNRRPPSNKSQTSKRQMWKILAQLYFRRIPYTSVEFKSADLDPMATGIESGEVLLFSFCNCHF